MDRLRTIGCVAMLLLCGVACWAQAANQNDLRALFHQAVDLVLPRDTAPVSPGDLRVTLRVVPPKGHESQVIFLLHGKTTTAEAMQAVSVRQEFDKWAAAGQTPDLKEWANTVPMQKTNFEVPPEMRVFLDSYGTVDFAQCIKQQDTTPGAIHYELWVENGQNVKDIHAYSTHGQKCQGLQWMQQLRQSVRKQVPQLETK